VVLAYANGLHAPFLFDDAGAVLGNPTIRSLTSLAVLNPPADGSTTTGRPLVNLSYALNYAFGGENVAGYRALNIAIHALAALTLLSLLRRTFSCARGRSPLAGDGSASSRAGALLPSPFNREAAAVTIASLWALHPLQTESVVGIAQRTELLCGLLYLLTLCAFARATLPSEGGARFPQRASLALSVVACLCGMASKEVMVTAPLAVLLYDRTFVAGTFTAALRLRRGYYAALAATWLLLAFLVLQNSGARGASAGFGLGITPWNYLLKQCEAIVLYLRLSLWPHPLVLDYGTAVPAALAEVWWQGPVVLALLAATIWALVRRPLLGFAGAWFFLILAPSSSLVPLVTQTMAEHRMYLPLAAVMTLAVLPLWRALGRRAAFVIFAAALACGVTTAVRNHTYRDALSIWTDNVAAHPTGARGHNNLALALTQSGRADDADVHYRKAVELQPDYISAHYNRGVALLAQGRVADAIVSLEIAVRLAPTHADAHLNLGNALVRARREADAVPHYEASLRIHPAADAHYNLAVALAAIGRDREADARLESALRLDPALAVARTQLARNLSRQGLALAQSGRLADAIAPLTRAVALQPDFVEAHANLGNVLLLSGRAADAVRAFETALRLRPDDYRLHENLAAARAALVRP
jgi:tetratricopeptide (TPR) repeat protein